MVTGFQQAVFLYPAPGVWGARASMNPIATVDAGPFNLTAGTLGTSVGKFGWQSYTASTGLGVVNSYSPTAPIIPDGFVANEQQVLITTWLGLNGMVIPAGYPVTLYNRGDFWAKSVYADAAIGNKVFANLFSGDVYPAAAGAFVSAQVGSAASFNATTTAGSYVLTVNSWTSGQLAVGQQISTAIAGLNPEIAYYIESAGTLSLPATSGTGTVNLTAAAVASVTGAFTSLAQVGVGGATCTSVTGGSGSPNLTINAVPVGVLAVGQLVQPITNITPGTYIATLGTWNGSTGYVVLNQNPTGTITAQACNFSAFIETPWYFNSAGNVGDLCKIGTRW